MANILLIEPNTLLAKTFVHALQHAGHQVAHATSAQTAIHAADSQKPDVVILELQLPAHNGLEFLHEFRSYIDWKSVPVIVNTVIPLSSFGLSLEALKRDLGVHVVAYKPRTSLQDLLRLVREHIPATA